MTPEQIAAGARTVAHLDTYFAEMEQTALALQVQVAARTRGYFTPSEDEATRQLLISYWQARCALYELVVSFREDEQLPTDLRPRAFVVAYAGAILLVHAARFLREAFADSPVVRAKLNEPEPYFGIPADTYDTVQKSLTSLRNAWRLHHARRYYEQHAAELQALRDDPLFAPALAVIERLGHRLHVGHFDLASSRMRERAHELAVGLRRDLFGRALYGLAKLAGCVTAEISTRPGHRPLIPAAIRAELIPHLRPGDVFITRKEHALSNYFLPGFWPHAAMYLGDAGELAALGIGEQEHVRPRWARLLATAPDEPRRVLEAMKDGVHIRSLDSPCGSDAFVVVRPRLDPPLIAQALVRGLFHEGKPYDFDFDFSRSDRLVCTEVVYRSYEGLGGMNFQLVRRVGRLTLSAEDLLQMALARTGFEPVAAYAPQHGQGLQTGPAVDVLLRKTCAAQRLAEEIRLPRTGRAAL